MARKQKSPEPPAQSLAAQAVGGVDLAGIAPDLLETLPINKVQLDPLVVLKIIKHSKDYYPITATGQLLGVDVKGTCEVTNSFPFTNSNSADKNRGDEEVGGSSSALPDLDSQNMDGAEYQLQMLRCLRKLNFDANTVGWYQSTYLGSFWNQTFIETQYNYQKSLPQAVVIVYDPTTREGQVGGGPLRAYRLSADFMNKLKDGVFSSDVCATFSAASILENVPIVIKNSYMVNSLLLTLDEQASLSSYILESVDQPRASFAGTVVSSVPPTKNLDPASCLGLENYLEKNLEYLGETIEEHSQEQWRWHG